MEPEETPDSSPLRPLRRASDRVERLRSGAGEDAYSLVLDVAAAVDWTLRRTLRDDAEAPLEARLSALAPDELRPDEVLRELRRHERISIEAAASVHRLFEVRQRLAGGGALEPGDPSLAVAVADRLEAELGSPGPRGRVATQPLLDEEVHAVPSEAEEERRSERRWLPHLLGAVVLALVVFALVQWLGNRGDHRMEQGIALFRSGSYEDAAHHFHRYASDNPRDATPHLYLARIHRRLGRTDLAGPALQEALRLAPDDPAVHRELGFLLMDTGRYPVAVERFRQALAMDAESPEGWLGLVLALRRDGRAAEAERVLARAPVQVRERFERQSGSAPPP